MRSLSPRTCIVAVGSVHASQQIADIQRAMGHRKITTGQSIPAKKAKLSISPTDTNDSNSTCGRGLTRGEIIGRISNAKSLPTNTIVDDTLTVNGGTQNNSIMQSPMIDVELEEDRPLLPSTPIASTNERVEKESNCLSGVNSSNDSQGLTSGTSNKKITDDWREELEESLIEMYQARPFLYSKNAPGYSNHYKKIQLYRKWKRNCTKILSEIIYKFLCNI